MSTLVPGITISAIAVAANASRWMPDTMGGRVAALTDFAAPR